MANGSSSRLTIAFDNSNASTTSGAVSVTVNEQAVAPGVYYIESDHLNSPRVIKDQNHNVVWKWDSDPFGEAAANEDPDGDRIRFDYALRFPGQYYDKETGLNYNYFRSYDPQTGRYVQSDPIGLAGGINTYGYVGGNPIGLIDPFGLWSFGVEGYAGLGGGVTIGQDSVTEQPFINLRVGYGLGGGFDYDPFAKRPGSDMCDKSSGEGFGVYGKTGGRLGPIKAGVGFNAGVQNGSSALPTNPYGTFASPKISVTNRGTGISASAAAGVEVTIYGRSPR